MNSRLCLAALLLPACSAPAEVSVSVTTGQEEGALALDPEVATVTITATSPDESVKLTASAAPGGSFDLGDVPDTSILGFEVAGETADGEVVARGRSVSVPIGSLGTLELPLFIQRLGSFARVPGDLTRAHVRAPAVIFGERYVITTGGEAAHGESGEVDPSLGERYDLLGWVSSGSEATFSRPARSMVALGDVLLLIDDEGADFVDPYSFAVEDAPPPDGLAFADVAGGRTVEGDGFTFVVGPTRASAPSDAVLVIDASGGFSAVRLTQARAGAAATWVDGVGLVIAGGALEGPGVETIGTDGATLGSVPYPSDTVSGAAAVVTAADQIALLGGTDAAGDVAPTRIVDLRCQVDCAATIAADLELPLVRAFGQAFNLTSSILVVGEDSDGETHAVRVTLEPGGVETLPFKQRRFGATISPAPNGTLMVLGGVTPGGEPATSVELFFPD